jgi:hypothetical protein
VSPPSGSKRSQETGNRLRKRRPSLVAVLGSSSGSATTTTTITISSSLLPAALRQQRFSSSLLHLYVPMSRPCRSGGSRGHTSLRKCTAKARAAKARECSEGPCRTEDLRAARASRVRSRRGCGCSRMGRLAVMCGCDTFADGPYVPLPRWRIDLLVDRIQPPCTLVDRIQPPCTFVDQQDPPGPDSLLARAVSQNHDCTLRQHSAADSLLKVPSQRTAVILADPAACSSRCADRPRADLRGSAYGPASGPGGLRSVPSPYLRSLSHPCLSLCIILLIYPLMLLPCGL